MEYYKITYAITGQPGRYRIFVKAKCEKYAKEMAESILTSRGYLKGYHVLSVDYAFSD